MNKIKKKMHTIIYSYILLHCYILHNCYITVFITNYGWFEHKIKIFFETEVYKNKWFLCKIKATIYIKATIRFVSVDQIRNTVLVFTNTSDINMEKYFQYDYLYVLNKGDS